jgi:hypothetical protein
MGFSLDFPCGSTSSFPAQEAPHVPKPPAVVVNASPPPRASAARSDPASWTPSSSRSDAYMSVPGSDRVFVAASSAANASPHAIADYEMRFLFRRFHEFGVRKGFSSV